MDGLDVRILRALGINPFGREPHPPLSLFPAKLAEAVGATKDRVSDRIAKMRNAGIIRGWQINVNHRHLGLESSCYLYRFPDEASADRAMEALVPAEGIAGCYAFIGGVMCVLITYASPLALERRMKLLVGLTGEGSLYKFFDLDMPIVSRPLSNLDWRVILALRGDALRPLKEVGDPLGVSAKTVKRHFDRMVQEGSVFITPSLDPGRAEGGMMFYLAVHLDAESDADPRNALQKAFRDHSLALDSPSTLAIGHLVFTLFARSVAEADELRRRAEAVPGVTMATPYLFRAAGGGGEGWEDELIAQKVKETARGATPEPVIVAPRPASPARRR